jgi:NitT/TauT family transport system substrate-binding protein
LGLVYYCLMHKSFITSLAVIILMCLVGFGFFISTRKKSESVPLAAQGPQSIKIGYMPFTTNWPVFIAMEQGIFEKHGLKVELVSFNSGVDAANAVVSNQVSAHAVNTFVDLFNLEARSPGRIKVFALQRLSADAYSEALLARKDSGIQKVEDLKGKKIGITPGAFTETIVQEAYKEKIDLRKEANFVTLAPNLQVSALESGQIDALVTYEPYMTMTVMKDVGYVVDEHFFKHVAEPFYLGGFTISQEVVENDPQLAEKIIASFDEAIALGNADIDKKNSAIQKYTSLDSETISSLHFSENIQNSEIPVGDLQQTADLYKSLGLFEGNVDVESMVYAVE